MEDRAYLQNLDMRMMISESSIGYTPEAKASQGYQMTDLECIARAMGPGTSAADAKRVLSELDTTGCSEQALCEAGMGEAAAIALCAGWELHRRRKGKYKASITSPQDAWNLIRHYGDREVEQFVVLTLDGCHHVTDVMVVSTGSANNCIAHPREIFAPAVKSHAVAIIVAHNHPSGNLEPSKEDLEVTDRLVQAGKILGIKLMDHLIFDIDSFISMREDDLAGFEV